MSPEQVERLAELFAVLGALARIKEHLNGGA
jgi:hypothetical protein